MLRSGDALAKWPTVVRLPSGLAHGRRTPEAPGSNPGEDCEDCAHATRILKHTHRPLSKAHTPQYTHTKAHMPSKQPMQRTMLPARAMQHWEDDIGLERALISVENCDLSAAARWLRAPEEEEEEPPAEEPAAEEFFEAPAPAAPAVEAEGKKKGKAKKGKAAAEAAAAEAAAAEKASAMKARSKRAGGAESGLGNNASGAGSASSARIAASSTPMRDSAL